MRVHMCGVRGSTPSPGADFGEVGGHTSCVAVAHDGEPPALALDAGTGLRLLSGLLGGGPFVGTLILTHLHWDHLLGLPFFTAGDRPDAVVRVMVPEQGERPIELLRRVMSPPLFPIHPEQLRGHWTFESYDEGEFEIDGFTIAAREVPHSAGRTMGLRVTDGSASVAYVPDHSPQTAGPGSDGLGELHDAALALAKGADALLHDAQYTRHELPARFTWGHSAADYVATLAAAAGVDLALMFHHDPWRTDAQVAALAAAVAASSGVAVGVATEGMVLDLPRRRSPGNA
jgi:phosphoribosyl 1,2-cyclic phosphodiesterase